MRSHSTARTAWSLLLVLLFFVEVAGAAASHPTPRSPTARSRNHLTTSNTEALRKVIQAPAHAATRAAGIAARPPTPRRPITPGTGVTPDTGHGPSQALSHLNAAASPGGLAVGRGAKMNALIPAVTRTINHTGVLGGAATASTLTPFHRAPATPVSLGGVPSHLRVGSAVVGGNAFSHRP